MSAILVAVGGPLKGAIFKLGQDEVSIGRHPSNDLCIGDLSVSRRHSVIRAGADGYVLRDAGSHNGTLCNGMPVDATPLAPGDTIQIGNTVLRYEAEEPASGAASASEWDLLATATVQLKPEQSEQLRRQALDTALPVKAGADLEFLLRIADLVNSGSDFGPLGVQILQCMAELVSACRGAVMMMYAAGSADAAAVLTWAEGGPGQDVPPPAAAAFEECLRSGSPVRLPAGNLWPASGCETVVALPLTVSARPIGVICLAGSDASVEDKTLRLLAAVSGSVSLALDCAFRARRNAAVEPPSPIKHVMIGNSSRMREMYQRIARIAPTDATVLVRGETGTGKELAARAIHQNSPRAGRPFEALNCALLKDTLLESELFGHEKGAFTGAVGLQKGKLELADGGTIFLDEVGELGEGPQSMLLRVLQERCFQRLGGARTIDVDIRIIAATNRDLEEAIRKGTFREDLYYRLNVVSLKMPPLRERRQDIASLAAHFVRKYSQRHQRGVAGISLEAGVLLERYDWPGNVRELENAIEYAVIFGYSDEVVSEDLPDHLRTGAAPREGEPFGYQEAVKEAKRAIVLNALNRADGNYSKAAKLLDIHVNNLHRLIREFNLRSQLQTIH